MPSATEPDLSPLPPTLPPNRRSARRWVAFLAVSLLIHLTILDVLPHLSWQAVDASDAADDATDHGEPLRARLVPSVAPVAVATPPPTPASPPRPSPAAPKPASRAPATRPSVQPPPFVPESLDVPVEVATAPPLAAAPGPAVDPPPVAASGPSAPPAAASAATPAAIAPPRSARLDYQVLSQKTREANPIYGVGTIDWSAADGRYAIDLHADAKLLFFNIGVLTSHSEGTMGALGLEPARYLESPRKRAPMAVNFNRDERRSVTFSASSAIVPLASGTQDRLSILFQIGGLLLGDARQAAQGAHFVVPVAGVRGEVDLWDFESLGTEAVDTPHGGVPSTHLRRIPKAGSNDRGIDLWVADDGGYPARVVYTERDGSTVTMTLDQVDAKD